MDWKQALGGKEALHWKRKYERCVKMSKLIWAYRHIIQSIKDYLAKEEYFMAAELWDQLATEIQQSLITAPRFGGPFTTEERAKIKELWEVTADDID